MGIGLNDIFIGRTGREYIVWLSHSGLLAAQHANVHTPLFELCHIVGRQDTTVVDLPEQFDQSGQIGHIKAGCAATIYFLAHGRDLTLCREGVELVIGFKIALDAVALGVEFGFGFVDGEVKRGDELLIAPRAIFFIDIAKFAFAGSKKDEQGQRHDKENRVDDETDIARLAPIVFCRHRGKG